MDLLPESAGPAAVAKATALACDVVFARGRRRAELSDVLGAIEDFKAALAFNDRVADRLNSMTAISIMQEMGPMLEPFQGWVVAGNM